MSNKTDYNADELAAIKANAELDDDPNANPFLNGLSYNQFHGKSAITPEVCGHCDGSHWGLDDLYPDWEAVCRQAHDRFIASNAPYHLSWASKHELWHADIRANGDNIQVSATVRSDEGEDLFDDLLFELRPEDSGAWDGADCLFCYDIHPSEANNLCDLWVAGMEGERLQDNASADRFLPKCATWDDIMASLESALDEAEAELDDAHESEEIALHEWLVNIREYEPGLRR